MICSYRRAGTVGLPLLGVEAKVCDAAGLELPRDGFFITGNLAQQDADGYVTILGRGKDLIISGGLNIYPKEIEAVLDAQPGVIESAVIGVPHSDLGEAAVGVLATLDSVDTDAVLAVLRITLARFKHPRKLIIVSELPRNSMGKVQKASLREAYRDLFD